jgi:hypothetical protein
LSGEIARGRELDAQVNDHRAQQGLAPLAEGRGAASQFWNALGQGVSDGLDLLNGKLTLGLIPYYKDRADQARQRGGGSAFYWCAEVAAGMGTDALFMAAGMQAASTKRFFRL